MSCVQHHDAHPGCPTCDIGPFLRNNYFTGKLLLERDFTTEQQYVIDKLRHHHQRLHGWGVVCGLKVKPHPNPNCQDRFVCIEPGTAIDCCGHEILVREEECIDLTKIPAVKELIENIKPDAGIDHEKPTTHRLQIRLCYRECPTEEIPVLYDECGCEDTRCAPNRILESYAVDVVVNPDPSEPRVHCPHLRLESNAAFLADVERVVVDEKRNRLYAAVGDTVYRIDGNAVIVESLQFAGLQVLNLAVAISGDTLFVATNDATVPADVNVHLVVTATMQEGEQFRLSGAVGKTVDLAAGVDDGLFALVGDQLFFWPSDALAATPVDDAKRKSWALGASGSMLAVSASGNSALVAVGGTVKRADRSVAGTVTDVYPPTAAGAGPLIIAAGGESTLVVFDGGTLNVVDLTAVGPAPASAAWTAGAPVAVAVSPTGRWGYVLLKDASKGDMVQVVDLQKVRDKAADGMLPVSIEVGKGSTELVLSASGERLYVPYRATQTQVPAGKPVVGTDAGIAVVKISEGCCDEILWRHLDGCDPCPTPNCVPIATIESWVPAPPGEPGRKIAAVPASDGSVAWIDNKQRKLLPSTETLLELIQCLCGEGCGGAGEQGKPGEPSKPGKDGQPGRQGDPGPGLETGLTRIEALSWRHGEAGVAVDVQPVDKLPTGAPSPPIRGVVIGFGDRVVHVKTPRWRVDAEHVFQVRIVPQKGEAAGEALKQGFLCDCALRGRVVPVEYKVHPLDDRLIVEANEVDSAMAHGIAFLFDPPTIAAQQLLSDSRTEARIQLRGDLVVAKDERAIDAEFVRAELPTGNRPDKFNQAPPTDLGIQGGTFYSWFTGFHKRDDFSPVDLNSATRPVLIKVKGIGSGLADRILQARKQQSFADLADFHKRVAPEAEAWELMRTSVMVKREK